MLKMKIINRQATTVKLFSLAMKKVNKSLELFPSQLIYLQKLRISTSLQSLSIQLIIQPLRAN